ncbi:undecaprenyl-diphosphatase UppP [Patescibacteria group bacterium]|nr:undecaprenyl-diphosphatase UppP [Patescibacteria group bacterium]
MDFLTAIVLGWVQGVTEFLPVSSTGHLILARELFSLESGTGDLAFDAVLHLATLCAILLYFHKDILGLIHTTFRMVGRLPVDTRDVFLIKALIYGTIPAVVCGFLLEDTMETAFRSPILVAVVLLAGSAIFAYAEYMQAHGERKAITPQLGFKVGLFQVLALIPGMSRSGITIAGGLILGLTRFEAARFAFLLAIPVMLGGGGKKLLELMGDSSGGVNWLSVGAGAVTAFVVGLLAIHFMMNFLRKYSLWPFIWYRVLLAIFVIALVFFE